MMRTVTLSVLLVVGCLPFDAPKRPKYDDACTPSDTTFLAAARSSQYRTPLDQIPDDPADARDAALEKIRAAGYIVRKKTESDRRLLRQWNEFTTTLPGVVLLEPDWDSKPAISQAALLEHEYTHVRQQIDMGVQDFFLWYSVPEGRWALETSAFAGDFALQVYYDVPAGRVIESINIGVPRFFERYGLQRMPDCTMETTAEIWLEGAGIP